ncbi:MAG: glycosyltransferase [Bradyrhizobium sp.]|nr:glycosyltransferase [Bradyrhizobium sp.]
MRSRLEFLNLDFDAWTMDEVETWLTNRDADSPFGYLVTPNVDHMVRLAGADDDVRLAYTDADLCICDSRVLKRVGRLCGVGLSVVPGSDLVAATFDHLLRDGDRVCLIGGTAESAEGLQQRFPGITILHHAPPMGLRNDPVARSAAIDFAQQAQARIVLLAVGSPQQELLAREMASSGRVQGTALCIGASVDFIVGAQSRAPGFVQRAGFEWCWRLMKHPRRLARRYLIDGPKILPMALRWRWPARGRA